MIRTYLDTNIIITACLGCGDDLNAALQILDDQNRVFVSSVFLELELLPKPVKNKQATTIKQYEHFFGVVQTWAEITNELLELALQEGCALGLGAMDALHLASARMAGVD